jgi:VWFA-related protein
VRRPGWSIALILVVAVSLVPVCAAQAAESPVAGPGYTLSLPVNEISLTFHVSYPSGATVKDLTSADFRLFDNGALQTGIVEFEAYHHLPIRAGILMDTSVSMEGAAAHNVEVAIAYLARDFDRTRDRGFVMRFDDETHLATAWTSNAGFLADGLHAGASEAGKGFAGTAIFDSIYTACHDQWPANSGDATGNFILLFTDGEDNASHARIDDVIDRCQRSRTAIYVVLNQWKARASRGQQTLEELVSKSGGRIFYQPSDAQLEEDFAMMEDDLRNQYRLVYRVPGLNRDGSFHRIKLECNVKGAQVLTRSGYYAATRR